MASTEADVRQIIAETLMKDADEIRLEHELVADLDVDSLDLWELATNLEEEFEVEIRHDQAEAWRTVADVCRTLRVPRG